MCMIFLKSSQLISPLFAIGIKISTNRVAEPIKACVILKIRVKFLYVFWNKL